MDDHCQLTRAKLKEAKSNIKLFGLDYDGTISDGAEFKQPQVFSLIGKILDAKKSVALVTARAATAIKVLAPPFKELISRKTIDFPNFIAGGNGTILFEIKKNSLKEIYNHGLDMNEIMHAVKIGKKVFKNFKIKNSDLSEKGLKTFREFLSDNWEGYVPDNILDICRPYSGELFTEQAKVTFVLPKDKSLHKSLIDQLNNNLGGKLQATAGDDNYVHITKKLNEDGKAMAIKAILQILGFSINEVATFGDMPQGNDEGLLSFPYSFTNSDYYRSSKKYFNKPPYVLPNPDMVPVKRVYEAINFLL